MDATFPESPPRRLDSEELATILDAHRAWVASGGREGQAADLARAGLRKADLRGLDLQGASLTGADLTGADLRGANLRKLDLQGVRLVKADLTGCNLYKTVLRGVDLTDARMRRADLSRADLREADLSGANLQGADLHCACLQGAVLRRANLRDANLADAELTAALGLLGGQLGGASLANARLPEDLLKFEGLSNVAEASKNTQNLFTSLLLVCAYTWLTIASTTDSQLLNNAAPPSSRLPILGTDIPLVRFYMAAPLLLLCLYVYFHLGLQRLWEELAELPAIFPDGRPLDKKAYPWLMNVLIRAHAARLKDNRSHLSRWQARMSVLLAWGLVPLTLLVLWVRYLRGHDWMVTGLHIALLAGSVGAGVGFLRLASSTLRGSEKRPFLWQRAWKDARTSCAAATVGTAAVLALVSFGAIEGVDLELAKLPDVKVESVRGPKLLDPRHWVPQGLTLIGFSPFAQLTDASLSTKPANWVPRRPDASGTFAPVAGQKADELAAVKGADLEKRNLRYAQAYNSFFVNAYLRWVDARGADLRDSDLRNADFRDARLGRANFRSADLRAADLKRADLVETRFYETLLTEARFTGANLTRADLSKADLRSAKLDTLPGTGTEPPKPTILRSAKLVGAKLDGADLTGADLTGASLREAQLTSLFVAEPEKTGPSLRPTRLCEANLTGADLSLARLSGADLTKAVLTEANLQDADLRGADLTGAIGLTDAQLAQARTDSTTRLPDGSPALARSALERR